MDNFLTYGIQWNNREEGIKTSIYTKARTHEVAHSVHYLSLSKETSLWKDKESNGSYLQTIWNCMIHLGCCQIQRKWLHFTSWRVPFTRRIPEWLCSWFWEFSLDLWWQNSMIRTTFFFRVLNTQCGSAFLFLFKAKLVMPGCEMFPFGWINKDIAIFIFFQDNVLHHFQTSSSKRSYFLDELIFKLGMSQSVYPETHQSFLTVSDMFLSWA